MKRSDILWHWLHLRKCSKKAYDGGYAIGAFNVNNMEIVQGITEAARDLNAPLILQVSKAPGPTPTTPIW